MSLSTVAPKVCSNLRQHGHEESSYIDSTTVGWPVPGIGDHIARRHSDRLGVDGAESQLALAKGADLFLV
jgi:hypothetical protein